MFAKQIGKSMEVYVDDMLVKSKHVDQHITNLFETFIILKKYRMRLNPNKCAFGVGSGKFLGFMISQRGIQANPLENQGNPRHEGTGNFKKHLEPHWQGGSLNQVHL
ncbi:hypothetical protein PS2_040006 [Malus domestica]